MKIKSYKRLNYLLLLLITMISTSTFAVEKSATYQFDGFKLGDKYGSTIMNRTPYTQPCDNDPIDNKTRRFMVYGGLKCRRGVFPEETSVMLYLTYRKNDRYDQPVEAFAWLGGKYFNTRSNFPAKIAMSLTEVRKLFGKPTGTMHIRRSKRGGNILLVAIKFKGDVYAIINVKAPDVVIGYVVGSMPEDPMNEQWRGLHQMYRRYTIK